MVSASMTAGICAILVMLVMDVLIIRTNELARFARSQSSGSP